MKNALAASASLLLLGAAAQAEDRPNVLLVIVDDMGYHDLSVHGSDIYQTPNIDALAAQSARLTQGYASYPRCTPSRYGLMTATYPVKENKGKLAQWPDERNWVARLDAAGYDSRFVGKWHLGAGGPTGYGFDTSFGAGETGGTGSRFHPYNTRKGKGGRPAKGEKSPIPDVEAAGAPGQTLTEVLTDDAVAFIRQDRDEPFLMVLSYYAVHTPIEAKKADETRNAAEIGAHDFGDTPAFIKDGEGRRKMRQDDAAYAGMVEETDREVGRVLTALEEAGLAKDTIVVFTSDHGGLSNDGDARERHLATTNEPLRAGKGWLYEGGIRVPFFWRWPGVVPPQDDPSVMLGMDIGPTLLDLAEAGDLVRVDGESFAAELTSDAARADRTVFWHSRKARPYSTGDLPVTAMRRGDMKLLHFHLSDRVELYDLAEDPEEKFDLFMQQPELAAEMKAEMDAWRTARKARLAKKRPAKRR